MITKLIYRNVTKNFSKYVIYFFTLVMSVALFYIFNAIYFQENLVENLVGFNFVFQELQDTLFMISTIGFVIILFLILYANYLFLNNRYQEFKTYDNLGMSRKAMSLIIFIENLVIALLALVVGLVIGILFSQLMVIFMANVFEVDIVNYHFTIYPSVMAISLLYYLVVIAFVIILNLIVVNKTKFLPLLSSTKANKIKVSSSYANSFVIINIILSISYYFLTSSVIQILLSVIIVNTIIAVAFKLYHQTNNHSNYAFITLKFNTINILLLLLTVLFAFKTTTLLKVIAIALVIINLLIIRFTSQLYRFFANQLRSKINAYFYLLSFILSCIVLGLVIYELVNYKKYAVYDIFNYSYSNISRIIIIGFIALIILCYSMQFIWLFMKKIKSLYYAKINIFIFNGLRMTVKRSYFTQSIATLLLTITLIISINASIISAGLIAEKGEETPYYIQYDASFVKYNNNTTINPIWFDAHNIDYNYINPINSIWDNLDSNLKSKDYVKEYNELQIYSDKGYTYNDLTDYSNTNELTNTMLSTNIQFIGLTQYNNILKQQGIEPISLTKEQYYTTYTEDVTREITDTLINNNASININNHILKPVNTTQKVNYTNILFFPAIIVNDHELKSLSLDAVLLNIDTNLEKHDEYIALLNNDKNTNNSYDLMITKMDEYINYYLYKSIIVFTAVYFSIIALLICLVLLLFWQYRENKYNFKQYKLLFKRGIDKRLINKYLFFNSLLFYGVALVIAMLFTLGLFFSKNTMFDYYISYIGINSTLVNSAYPIIIIIITYIIFFAITHSLNQQMIKKIK